MQCHTGAYTDALPRGACFQIGPSGLLFSACAKLQISTGARLHTESPFHGARQAEICNFDMRRPRRERRSNHKTSFRPFVRSERKHTQGYNTTHTTRIRVRLIHGATILSFRLTR